MRIMGITAVGLAALSAAIIALADSSEAPPAVTSATQAAQSSAPGEAPTTGSSREFFEFENLDQMVATSSAVVEGFVLRTEEGQVVGAGHDEERYTNAVLQVRTVLAGEAPETVTIDQLTVSGGKPIVLDGVEPPQAGDQGIFFLRKKDEGLYTLISSQGRFLDRGDGRLQGANGEDKLVRELGKLDKQALKDQIKQAKQRTIAGRVNAIPYPRGLEKVE